MIEHFTKLSWIRYGIRDRLIRALHNPDTARPRAFDVDFFGLRYSGNFNTYIDWAVYYFGAYELGELHLARDQLRNTSSPIIFDVGANIGHHSLFYSTLSGVVHAFEPFPPVADKLRDRIEQNAITNVKLHRKGLGSRDDNLPFTPPEGCNSGTGSFLTKDSPADTSIINLQVRPGDDVVAELNIEELHFIKIDVEGFECEVLKGLHNTLRRFRPKVFFEWSQNNTQLCDVASYFPEQYEFFEVVSYPPRNLFFTEGTYRLKKVELDQLATRGNYFATCDGV